jgi:hypothetical protein
MRVTRRRLLAALILTALLAALAAGGRAFALACDGSLDTFPQLAAARQQLQPPRPAPQPVAVNAEPAPAPTSAAGGPPPAEIVSGLLKRLGFGLVSLTLQVKQSHAVAYPLHVTLATQLELARCPREAVWLQWIKAGIHATGQAQVEQVASALRRTLDGEQDRTRLNALVERFVQSEFWSSGIKQVQAALRQAGQD